MARTNNLTNFLTDVSSAIKQKTGDNTPIPASEFDTEILSIETGGNYQSKTLNVTQNGNYNLLPDQEFDAISNVNISVSVSPVLQNKTIRENGSYSADSGYDGLGTVIVNVPSGSGDIKLFETEQAMQADPNPSEGDLAVVYREELTGVTEESEFDSCTFPNTVVLDEAFSGSVQGRFRAVDSSSSYFDGIINMSSSYFGFIDRSVGGRINVRYTSSDGITYTRTDGGEELQEFGVTIKYEPTRPWNDVIGNFMKIGEKYFDGLYEYKTNNIDLYKTHFLLTSGLVITSSSTIEVTNNCWDSTWYDTEDLIELGNALGTVLSKTGTPKFFLRNNKLCFLTTTRTSFPSASSLCIDSNNDIIGIASDDLSYESTVYLYEVTNIQSHTYTLAGTYTGSRDNRSRTYVRISNIQSASISVGIRNATNEPYVELNKTVRIWNGTDLFNTKTINVTDAYRRYDAYFLASTQLDATPDYVYEKTFYGKNGVEVGTLTQAVSNSFADINAEVYSEIQKRYENMEPRILTDQDKTIDKSIYFIPVKKDGTPLLDTSKVTDTVYMFHDCYNLTSIPLLDTSNVTSMNNMFTYCESLTTIPLLDTSNVTNMNRMFHGCFNLTSIPLLDTSNVTNMGGMFGGCSNLTTIPLLDTSKVTNMTYMFTDCESLNNESLNNILAMCANAVKITSNKTLKYIGLTEEQANICKTLSNYSAFIAAGWTTGY